MRIGIDGRWFFGGPPGGHTYTRNFVEALLRVDVHEYVVFLGRDDAAREYPWPSHACPAAIGGGNSYTMNRWSIPRSPSSKSLDWTLTHNFSPRFGAARRAVIVHDLTFVSHPEAFTWKERLFFSRIKPSLRQADLILTVSRYVADDVKARGYARPDQSVVVVPNAAAPVYARPSEADVARVRARHGLEGDYILYLGRLNKRKNLDRLIDAFASAEIDEGVTLALAGRENWKMFDLDAYLAARKLTHRVKRLGFVDVADTPGLYAGARFFAYVPLAEGFGLPPLEAMACGTPVLASNTTSLPEVVQDSGVLVDPTSVASIAAGIEALANDADVHRAKQANTLRDAATYSWERSAATFLGTLESIN